MSKRDIPKVALVGNPNSGKSSLFNHLTGLNQRIGNFPGVTVDKKTGYCSLNGETKAEIIDLPGTYSIYPNSTDEKIVYDILGDKTNPLHPDVVVVIVDASNFKRNLLLFTQIHDLNIPTVLALNMMDIVEKTGLAIDEKKLSQELGVPVIPMKARKGKGIDLLKKTLVEICPANYEPIFKAHDHAPEAIDKVKEAFSIKDDYVAYQMLQQYRINQALTENERNLLADISEKYSFNRDELRRKETLERYAAINYFIDGAVKENFTQLPKRWTQKLDSIFTHKIWGYFIFFLILFLIFQSIFAWATIPMDFIDLTFSELSSFLKSTLPEGALSDLLTEGIIPGIGGIVIFIPQIAILFAFIAILEETGYMSRVVFLMDKIMRKFGLNGKSVVPLISGVACAIPAIMATRTIENWKERLITIFVTPLMSCSARLPVYTILIALIIPDKTIFGIFNLQGLALMGMYLLGFAAAIISALIMRFILKTKERSFFVMELPTYKAPRWKNVGMTMYEKSKTFVLEAGKIILAISIVLWVLASYGPGDQIENAEAYVQAEYSTVQLTQEEIENKIESYKLEHSYAGIFGKAIEPVIRPLGYDWKIGIALITSFAAREVFVGTMATIYSIGNVDDESTIKNRMKNEINPETGKVRYDFATGLSLLVFYAFAMQCMSTMAVVYRETKGWKWPLAQLVYMTGLAYVSALIIYQSLS
ncbi:Ferrous iron transport protein B [Fulvivirga imtechensis AK7]|uniref:Ferrous iron transport protein B n=1 Tax=Fulvivirga imtechensis AK7 TaxID=1237149 RepID=L8JT59_9BACT|nr:ferrous iron transport protein B [Fulvivirga imtechensis]ELR70674.1 Ferrous iron transport protein B [Fulvivirga imtechensis AK7]